MGVGPSARVRSHRFGYPIPPSQGEEQSLLKQPEKINPIAYILCWDKYNHGMPVDITKAKEGTRADLMAADPQDIELMIAYSVTQKQIATQFNTPLGSLSKILKELGVNTKVPLLVNSGEQHIEAASVVIQEDEGIPLDLSASAQEEEMWFTEPNQTCKAVVIVRKDQVVFAAGIGAEIDLEYVQFGLTRENHLKVKAADHGFKFHVHKGHSNRKTVCCNDLVHELQKRGIPLPAIFEMELNSEQHVWEGALQDAAHSR